MKAEPARKSQYPGKYYKREVGLLLNEFDDKLFGFLAYIHEGNKENRLKVNDRSSNLNLEEFSYRIRNHWEKEGLLSVDRGSNGSGWRLFSIMDTVWISIILSLRKFGVSLANIKKVKEALTYSFLEGSEFPYLEYQCAKYYNDQSPTYLLVFSDFHAEVAGISAIETVQCIGRIDKDFIRIDIGEILSSIMPQKQFKTNYKSTVELDANELSVLNDIRSRRYKEISLELRNGKILRASKEIANPEQQLHKAVNSMLNGVVTAIIKDGKIVNVNQIEKEKKS